MNLIILQGYIREELKKRNKTNLFDRKILERGKTRDVCSA